MDKIKITLLDQDSTSNQSTQNDPKNDPQNNPPEDISEDMSELNLEEFDLKEIEPEYNNDFKDEKNIQKLKYFKSDCRKY